MFAVDMRISIVAKIASISSRNLVCFLDDNQSALTEKTFLFLVATMYNARYDYPAFFLPVFPYKQNLLGHLLEAFFSS